MGGPGPCPICPVGNQSLGAELPDFILQQDGAPPHWNINVREFLNEHLPHCCIGHSGPQDLTCLHWLLRSPDLIPCDFFFSGVSLKKQGVCASTYSGLRETEAVDNCSVELYHRGYAMTSVAGA